jgi:hypothetical protein
MASHYTSTTTLYNIYKIKAPITFPVFLILNHHHLHLYWVLWFVHSFHHVKIATQRGERAYILPNIFSNFMSFYNCPQYATCNSKFETNQQNYLITYNFFKNISNSIKLQKYIWYVWTRRF